jgi:hypothetical protein
MLPRCDIVFEGQNDNKFRDSLVLEQLSRLKMLG